MLVETHEISIIKEIAPHQFQHNKALQNQHFRLQPKVLLQDNPTCSIKSLSRIRIQVFQIQKMLVMRRVQYFLNLQLLKMKMQECQVWK